MRPHSPSAFLASITLHGVVLAIVLFFTYHTLRNQDTPPVVFELVAGEPAPDGSAQLVAPKLGNSPTPTKTQQEMPEPEPATAAPQPPEPVKTVTPPEPKVTPAPTPTPPKPKATPTPPKPKTQPSLSQEMKQAKRVSYKDYLKKNPIPKQTAAAPSTGGKSGKSSPRVDVEGIAGGVRGGSAANKKGGEGGKALTRSEQAAWDVYLAKLKLALHNAHEPEPGISDQLSCQVTFDITASGSVLNAQITRSSGNADFDRSVLAAFRRLKSLGPTPDRKSETVVIIFKLSED